MKRYPYVRMVLPVVLKLYPKKFRDIYDEQIELTLQDILGRRVRGDKVYTVCASLAEIAFFGVRLSIKEWIEMSKKISVAVTSVAIAAAVVAVSVYLATQASCVLPGRCRAAGVYGALLTYPKEWSAKNEKFFVNRNTRAAGLTITAPKSTIRVAIAAEYTGMLGAEAGFPTASGIRGKLVSMDPAPHLDGVSVIKWIEYDNTGQTYIALENIVSTAQVKQLGFVMGKFVPLAAPPQLLFERPGGGPKLNAGFNSQQPLSLAQANAWFNTKDATTAHKVLLSLKENV
ncbi:MAG TPA: hypothetical protein VLI54_00790 [Bacillota bacterium]|nr:hypothetical protein [Bacillota bacterium]